MEFEFPETPAEINQCTQIIKDKIAADGAGGEMVTMVANKNIDWDDNLADGEACILLKQSFNEKSGLAKGKNFEKNRIIKNVAKHFRAIGQNGKLVLPTLSELGEYGYHIIQGKAILFPRRLQDLKKLVAAVKAKVDSFTFPDCPLTPFIILKNYDLDADLLLLDDAVLLSDDAKQIYAETKGYTNTIAKKMEKSELSIRYIAAMVVDIYGADPAAAARYGLKTRDTEAIEKEQVSSILPTDFRTIEDLVKLTYLVNNSAYTLRVRKGKRRTGVYKILPANGKLLITYGYGTCTVENFSNSLPSKVTATVLRKVKKA